MTTKELSFSEILGMADQYRHRMRRLARILETDNPFAMSGDPYDEIAAELAHYVSAVYQALKLIGEAYNAYVNREALDALAHPVVRAGEMLATDWVIELLSRSPELPGDEIPF